MRAHLESGGLVVYPTSTLPGLGCLPIPSGLDNLYSTKNRPETMPVSLGVSSMEQVEAIVEIPDFLDDFLHLKSMRAYIKSMLSRPEEHIIIRSNQRK